MRIVSKPTVPEMSAEDRAKADALDLSMRQQQVEFTRYTYGFHD